MARRLVSDATPSSRLSSISQGPIGRLVSEPIERPPSKISSSCTVTRKLRSSDIAEPPHAKIWFLRNVPFGIATDVLHAHIRRAHDSCQAEIELFPGQHLMEGKAQYAVVKLSSSCVLEAFRLASHPENIIECHKISPGLFRTFVTDQSEVIKFEYERTPTNEYNAKKQIVRIEAEEEVMKKTIWRQVTDMVTRIVSMGRTLSGGLVRLLDTAIDVATSGAQIASTVFRTTCTVLNFVSDTLAAISACISVATLIDVLLSEISHGSPLITIRSNLQLLETILRGMVCSLVSESVDGFCVLQAWAQELIRDLGHFVRNFALKMQSHVARHQRWQEPLAVSAAGLLITIVSGALTQSYLQIGVMAFKLAVDFEVDFRVTQMLEEMQHQSRVEQYLANLDIGMPSAELAQVKSTYAIQQLQLLITQLQALLVVKEDRSALQQRWEHLKKRANECWEKLCVISRDYVQPVFNKVMEFFEWIKHKLFIGDSHRLTMP